MTVEPSLAAPNPFNGILYTVLIVLRTGDIDFAVGFGAPDGIFLGDSI